MKKFFISAAILGLSSTAAFASADGLYAGVQAGYGDQGYDVHHAFIPFSSFGSGATDLSSSSLSTQVDSDGFAGRILVGYQYNPNLAIETGYSHFADSETRASNKLFNLNSTVKEQSLDVAGKLMYPLSTTATIYTKIGAAWLDADQDTHLSMQSLNQNGTIVINNMDVSTTSTPIRPLFGVGASYDLNQNISVDASWTRIEGNNLVQNIDFYGAGVVYHFT